MQRVSVIGAPGSGKSTLARQLAARMAVPHVELDAIFHQKDWTPLPQDEFARRVTAAADAHRWVIDGNYDSVLPLVWARADTVVWLDRPRRTAMRRLIWRTIRRTARRTELWNGNRERWQDLFSLDQDRSVIAWAWRQYPVYQVRYGAAMRDPALAHLRFIQVTGNADTHLLDS